jgi:ATP-dependent DNA ligase
MRHHYVWHMLCPSVFIPPCEPTLRDRLPRGEGWIYEVKFDGYRIQIHKAGDAITLYTRNGADWTERFPRLAAGLTALPCGSAIIDAELVHLVQRSPNRIPARPRATSRTPRRKGQY